MCILACNRVTRSLWQQSMHQIGAFMMHCNVVEIHAGRELHQEGALANNHVHIQMLGRGQQ